MHMQRRNTDNKADLKLRMSEELRDKIERAARGHGLSMNAEMITRLWWSFDDRDRGSMIGHTPGG
jgi:hypothetical protein